MKQDLSHHFSGGFVFEQAVEGMLLVDPTGKIVNINAAGLDIFGYKDSKELIGKEIEVLIPESVKSAHKKHRSTYVLSPHARGMGTDLDLKGIKKNGEQIEVKISLSPLKHESGFMVLAHVMDVTAQNQLKKRHYEREALLNSIIENAVDGIITIDKTGIIESLNPAAARLFGYQQEEAVGQNITLLMPEPFHSEHASYMENYHRTGKRKIIGIGREVLGKKKDGSIFPIKLSVSEIHYKDRRIYAGIIHDISDMKEAEKRLKAYAKELERSNRELEDFAYVSSHDLQEPLRKIQAFGNYIQDKESENLTEKGKDYLSRMLNAASRLQKLINDLLSYSRVSTKARPYESVNLDQVLQAVLSDLEILIQSKDAVVIAHDLATIQADYTQMRQLLQNLISNGLKFGKEDVRSEVIVSGNFYRKKGQQTPYENWFSLSVKDNGIGFDEKYKEKIFSIFQRLEGRKYEGSGIGLSIVKRIVHRHGGDIEVSSEKGEGTAFIIHLPVQQADTVETF